MIESGKKAFILRKSYEVAYALWRIAANIDEKAFADKLAGKAVELIGLGADADYGEIAANLLGVEFLIKFGTGVGAIGPANGELLFNEISILKAEIDHIQAKDFGAKILEDRRAKDIDLSNIFTSRKTDGEELGGFQETEIEIGEEGEGDDTTIEPAAKESGNMKAEIRQAAILARIRQVGNCRLGDIQAILPDISDRTIRYDLESLVERGLVERLGTGGRSVSYRVLDATEG